MAFYGVEIPKPRLANLVRAVEKPAAKGSLRLIPHKKDRRFRPPEVVLQMVLDPAGLAHPARRNNDLRATVFIDRFGLLRRRRDPKARKADRVNAV